MTPTQRTFATIAVGLAALWAVALSADPDTIHHDDPLPPDRAFPAEVTGVIDGDTIDVESRLGDMRIRILRIDAPEMGFGGGEPECWAREATERVEQLAPPGSEVKLAYDVEHIDDWGRHLAHVWAGGHWIAGVLLREGLAEPLTIPPNTEYSAHVEAAWAYGQGTRQGIHSDDCPGWSAPAPWTEEAYVARATPITRRRAGAGPGVRPPDPR